MLPIASNWRALSHAMAGRVTGPPGVYPAAVIHDRGFRLALLGFLPMFVWWLGWYPGILSSDSVDQLQQVASGDYTNGHPAFHTISMWFVTRFWDSAGAVSLVQIVLLALMLAVIAKRLIALGVPLWLAVGAVWATVLIPVVAPTALALWKDIAFTIAFLWVFAELLLLAHRGAEYWDDAWNPVRLGLALALVGSYRHNGIITAVVLLGALMWTYRRLGRPLLLLAGVTLAALLFIQVPLLAAFGVDRSVPAAAELMLGDIASSLVHEPGNFSREELAYLEQIGPLDAWTSAYTCHNQNPLLFHADIDIDAIRAAPGRMFNLGLRTILRDPDTTLGHRACLTSFLYAPGQPEGFRIVRPPLRIADNDQGIRRDPIWQGAFDLTRELYEFAGASHRLWYTWRPALVLWLGAITYALVARRRLWTLLWPGLLIGWHGFNVAVTALTQEFRLAFPLYVASLMSLPLLWFAYRPDQLHHPEPGSDPLGASVADGRALAD